MADDALRELERAWRAGGRLGDGQRFLHALERAGVDDERRAEVHQAVLRLEVTAAGFDASTLRPLELLPEPGAYRLVVPGADAAWAWRQLRARVEATRCWPLLLGDEAELDWIGDAVASDAPAAVLLAAVAEARDPSQVLAPARQAAAWEEQLRTARALGAPEALIEVLEQRLAGGVEPQVVWPRDASPSHTFATPLDLTTGDFLPRVVLGLLPVTEGAQVPAWLRFGGWTGCPLPAEHVQALRRWGERYGAEPLALTHDVLECHVEHPPTDRREALELAREQLAYCEDLGGPDGASLGLGELAGRLLGATAWTFWWPR